MATLVASRLVSIDPVPRATPVSTQPMDIETSARRNWMFALGGVIWFLKYIFILGWLLIGPVLLAAIVLGFYELYRVITDPQGRRLGDTMAGTKVIEVAD